MFKLDADFYYPSQSIWTKRRGTVYDVYMDVSSESTAVTFVKVWPEAAASLFLGEPTLEKYMARKSPYT